MTFSSKLNFILFTWGFILFQTLCVTNCRPEVNLENFDPPNVVAFYFLICHTLSWLNFQILQRLTHLKCKPVKFDEQGLKNQHVRDSVWHYLVLIHSDTDSVSYLRVLFNSDWHIVQFNSSCYIIIWEKKTKYILHQILSVLFIVSSIYIFTGHETHKT